MSEFGRSSRAKLNTCHPELQRVADVVIQEMDHTIIYGWRSEQIQMALYKAGKSTKAFGSKHNHVLAIRKNLVAASGDPWTSAMLPGVKQSNAIDVAPWPIDWKNINRFRLLAGLYLGVAVALGIKLRWGGDWDRDFSELDEKGLRDFGHLERLNK